VKGDSAPGRPSAVAAGVTSRALVPMWPDLDRHAGPLGGLIDLAARHLVSGRPDLALRAADAGIWAHRYGELAAVAQLGILRGRALLEVRRPAAAAEATRDVLDMLGRNGPPHRRAYALSLLALAEVEAGHAGGALDPLAEAMWLVRRHSGPDASRVRPVARVSAAVAVATALLRLLLVESAEEVLPRPRDISRRHRRLAVHVARCRSRLHVLWGLHLETAGDAAGAAERFRQAEAASLAIVRHGLVLREPVLAACGVAVEVFAADRLGRGSAAAARARAALAGGLAKTTMPEWQLGRIGLARVAAREGDDAAARALLADVAVASRADPYSAWTDLVLVTAAEIEAGVGTIPPAVAGWRRIAASGEGWIWDERQARAFDLHQRVARRELMERRERTSRELLVDPLTGAGNRRRLDAELAGRRRGGVVFVDLDEFKQVNDRYGHSVGDLVLRRLAAVLRLCCRDDDVLIRYGGDEFLILLGDDAADRPEDVGRRVLDRVRSEPWAATTGVPAVTVSVGTATGPLAVETVHRSDAAMFAAKRAGRDGMVRQ
jgi:diguanylate cyclase (GGDEF)-like protein